VRGRSELAITLLWREPAPSPPSPGGGRAYLEGRRAALSAAEVRCRRADDFAAHLDERLAPWRADVSHRTCPSDAVALSTAVLVPTGAAEEAKDAASQAISGLLEVRGVVSGPWPPYSFVPREVQE
jgi:hypothetical protein